MRFVALSLLMLSMMLPLHALEREIWGSFRLGLLGGDSDSAVFAVVKAGARDAAKALEKEHKLSIELIFKAPVEGDAHTQDGALGEFFIEGVDGIALDPHPGQELVDEISFLATQNIAVVCFHRDLPEHMRLAYIGSDQQALGRMAMKALAKAMGPRGGSVAVLAGPSGSDLARQRLDGAEAVAKEAGNFRPYGIFTCEEALTPALNTVRRVTAEDRDDRLNGWLFLGPWPLSGAAGLPWEADEMPCVAIGAEPPELPYLKQGTVNALVAQKYYDWGYQSVVMLIEKLYLKKDPEPAVILTDGELITPGNQAAYRAKWVEWLR